MHAVFGAAFSFSFRFFLFRFFFIFFVILWQHKTGIQKQSEQSVARPTLGQITATHQPLAARTPSQGAITSSLHRRGPDGQVYRF